MNDELNKNRMTLIRQIQGEGNDLLYVGPDTDNPRRVEIQLAHDQYMDPNPAYAKAREQERHALREYVGQLGGCPDCLTTPIHDVDEPFSSCKCETGEDYGSRPAQKEQILRAENERLKQQCDNWTETAKHYADGCEFYRGIIQDIGEKLGRPAYTSDDGSVQDDVLALHMPELVDALRAEVERLRGKAGETPNPDDALPPMPDKFYEALGWMHAECCATLDRGEDPRNTEVSGMVQRCIRDLTRDTGSLAEPDWLTHDSYEPPADLALAQLIYVDDSHLDIQRPQPVKVNDSGINWRPGLRYRPVLSGDGLPLCSAEGLETWATHVRVDESGEVWQFDRNPTDTDVTFAKGAPETHRRPGRASESVMEVHHD